MGRILAPNRDRIPGIRTSYIVSELQNLYFTPGTNMGHEVTKNGLGEKCATRGEKRNALKVLSENLKKNAM